MQVSVKDLSLDPEGSPVVSPQTGGLRVVTSVVAELKRRHREHAKCKVQEDISSEVFFSLHHVTNPWPNYDAECDCPTCGQPENAPNISLLASFKVVAVECKSVGEGLESRS